MKLKEIAAICDAIVPYQTPHLDQDYCFAFASDLMSDVLAMVTHDNDKTILVSGLINAQIVRTAEMLDIDVILLVRGKQLNRELIQDAKDSGIQLLTTYISMYEACGRLYEHGMKAF